MKQIVITLTKVSGSLSVTIKDNGIGFSPVKTGESPGIGLRIMQHRASLIGGKLDYLNGKNGGAIITCSVAHKEGPLPRRS